MTRCTATQTWPDIPPHGVRLTCALPTGHDGDHGCADIEYLPEPEPAAATGPAATGRVGGYAHEPETGSGVAS